MIMQGLTTFIRVCGRLSGPVIVALAGDRLAALGGSHHEVWTWYVIGLIGAGITLYMAETLATPPAASHVPHDIQIRNIGELRAVLAQGLVIQPVEVKVTALPAEASSAESEPSAEATPPPRLHVVSPATAPETQELVVESPKPLNAAEREARDRDLMAALVALGYTRTEAKRLSRLAVMTFPYASLEELVKCVLTRKENFRSDSIEYSGRGEWSSTTASVANPSPGDET